MTTYRILKAYESKVEFIKKIEEDGTVWTFRSDGETYHSIEYRKWLEEGNEPLPAD
tara:strand:- start:26172 stop:26339 length:168 start_codon:yes stop_codon:yes gene_type:complete